MGDVNSIKAAFFTHLSEFKASLGSAFGFSSAASSIDSRSKQRQLLH